MKIQQLIYFIEVCNCGSITEAASRLYVSQPSISSAIKELEKTVDTPLFRRVNKRLFITKEGQHLYTKAISIVEELEQLKSEIHDMAGQKNKVRIGLPMQVSSFVLPTLLGTFARTHPHVDLEVVELGSVDLLELLEQGDLHLAIMAYSSGQHRAVEYHRLFDSSIQFFTHKDNPLAQYDSLTIEDIGQQCITLPNKLYNVNDSVLKRFAATGCTPNVLMNASSLHTISTLICHDFSSAFLLRETNLWQADVRKIPIVPPIPVEVGVLTGKNATHSTEAKQVIQFIKKTYQTNLI